MIRRYKAINISVFVLFILLGLALSTVAQELVVSEIMGIHSEERMLLLDVAKKYPVVKFLDINNASGDYLLTIEILDSSYHKDFIFDESIKSSLLKELDFVSDISVQQTSENLVNKLIVSLVLKPSFDSSIFKPKILSTKNNIVKISIVDSQAEITSLYNKAVSEQLAGNNIIAEELYKTIISKENNFYIARFNLAKVYLDQAKYNEAESTLLNLISELTSTSSDSLILLQAKNSLGFIYCLIGKPNEANNLFQEVLKVKPDFFETHYLIGVLNEKLKDIKNAKLSFKKAIELNPGGAEAYYHLGVLELIEKNKKDAFQYFNKVIEISPTSEIGKLSQNEIDKLNQKGSKKVL